MLSGHADVESAIEGMKQGACDYLMKPVDMDQIIAQLDQGAQRGVVIGGSYIGLEVAEAFRERGLRTTLIERADRLASTARGVRHGALPGTASRRPSVINLDADRCVRTS